MSDSLLPRRWTEPAPPLAPMVSEGPDVDAGGAGFKSPLAFIPLIGRHPILVAIITLTALGLAYWKIRQQVPLYQAAAVIRIADRTRALSGTLGGNQNGQYMGPFTDPVLSQVQVLKSQSVAEGVVQAAGLQLRLSPKALPISWVDSVSVAPEATRDTLQLSFSKDSVRVRVNGREASAPFGTPLEIAGVRFRVPTAPELSSAQLVVLPVLEAANEVIAGLRALPRERTDVIDVDYIAADPVVAQRVVNTAVQVFQANNVRTAKQQSVLRREFIEQQLHKMELLLADAQAAHNSFRREHRVYSSREKFQEQQQDLSGIDVRRQELDADRHMYSSMLDAFSSGHQSSDVAARLGALASSPGLGTNLIVAQLYTELGHLQGARDSLTAGTWSRSPDNPDVKRLDAMIGSTEGKIIQAVRGQIAGIDARIAALDSLRKTVAGQMSSLPGTEAQEATLLTQVESYQKQVERLRDQLQTAQIEEAAEAGQVEIVDLAAFPGFRLGSGKGIKLIFAMMIGLLCGIGAAYLRENQHTVIRRRDELERVFAAPNLALVPRLVSATNGNGGALNATGRIFQRFARGENGARNGIALSKPNTELVTVNDARSNGAEAYRTLRTNLLFSAAVRRLRRIVITSPGPAEGKSLTAANLAIAFAQQGHRVLLIDCDLRRSRIHKMFDETQGPGLTDILVGQKTISDAARVTMVPGLSILPSGTHPPNPAELLGSDGMRSLLDTLSDSYDLLVIDTPPLLAASDAAIISTSADGALVVVRAGRTERSALQTAIQQLTTVGARVLGTVLNDPDAEVPKYARYYGYYYNNYYEYQNGVG